MGHDERSISTQGPNRGIASSAGFSLVEMLLAVSISAILIITLANVVANTLAVKDESRQQNALTREARFAMSRMVRAVRGTNRLVLPLVDNVATLQSESFRDPGVLAVTLDPSLDRDLDGFADADNDRDGAIDEDVGEDANEDGKPGIEGIDDNNDGIIDNTPGGDRDDDEDGLVNDEDPIDGIDNDGDGSIDEDPGPDMNGDLSPGVAGVDDDGDGFTDEGSIGDDDEDGSIDEDWLDTVVYFLSGTDLIERHPNLDPADGTDYTERTLAKNVSTFRVERLSRGINRNDLIELTLGLSAERTSVQVKQRVRVGGPR